MYFPAAAGLQGYAEADDAFTRMHQNEQRRAQATFDMDKIAAQAGENRDVIAAESRPRPVPHAPNVGLMPGSDMRSDLPTPADPAMPRPTVGLAAPAPAPAPAPAAAGTLVDVPMPPRRPSMIGIDDTPGISSIDVDAPAATQFAQRNISVLQATAMMDQIQRTLATGVNAPGSGLAQRTMGALMDTPMRAEARQEAIAASAWFGSDEGRRALSARPNDLLAATKDPISIYRKYNKADEFAVPGSSAPAASHAGLQPASQQAPAAGGQPSSPQAAVPTATPGIVVNAAVRVQEPPVSVPPAQAGVADPAERAKMRERASQGTSQFNQEVAMAHQTMSQFVTAQNAQWTEAMQQANMLEVDARRKALAGKGDEATKLRTDASNLRARAAEMLHQRDAYLEKTGETLRAKEMSFAVNRFVALNDTNTLSKVMTSHFGTPTIARLDGSMTGGQPNVFIMQQNQDQTWSPVTELKSGTPKVFSPKELASFAQAQSSYAYNQLVATRANTEFENESKLAREVRKIASEQGYQAAREVLVERAKQEGVKVEKYTRDGREGFLLRTPNKPDEVIFVEPPAQTNTPVGTQSPVMRIDLRSGAQK